ncbi:MAG: hypothetical protein U0835_00465 [Isosphaeraceae bacterium]
MSAQVLKHPAVTADEMMNRRLHYICEAIYFKRRGDRDNQSYCQGKASGLNDAIAMLGGESISMRLEDYEETVSGEG